MPLRILEQYCSRVDQLDLVSTFTSTTKASKWIAENEIDLLFLDINMPAISGLDFFKSTDSVNMVIFTTAYSEYAVEGFNLQAIDYLVKPYSFERFSQAIQRAADFHNMKSKGQKSEIFVKADLSNVKIATDEISFIEAYTDYVKIHRFDQKTIVTRMTMSHVLSLLPEGFIRVHRSYIIPISQIQKYKNRQIEIAESIIPIGKSYVKTVESILKKSL